MRILRTRDDLIAIARDNAPTTACGTAIRENRVTVLGGFNPLKGFPGWIVVIRSRFDKEWIIAVVLDERNHWYLTYQLATVPFEDWVGQSDGKPSLMNGDYPKETAYKRIRSKHAASRIQTIR